MILFPFIRGAMLHICGYRRLLIWSLLSCFLYASCSTQVRHGLKNTKNNWSKQTDIQDSARYKFALNPKELKMDESIDLESYWLFSKGSLQNATELYNDFKGINLTKKKLRSYNWGEYCILEIKRDKNEKVFVVLLKKTNAVPPSPALLKSVMDSILCLFVNSNNKAKHWSSNLKNHMMLYEILLACHDTEQKNGFDKVNGIHSDLFIDGNNLLHELFTNIKHMDSKQFELLLEQLNLMASSKQYPHIKQLLGLENKEGIDPLSVLIKIYCRETLYCREKSYSKINKERLKEILIIIITTNIKSIPKHTIKELLDPNYGNNELHFIVSLHNNNALSNDEKIFLEKSAKKLINTSSDLIHKLNNSNETPLDVAIQASNPKMVNILLNGTKLSQVKTNGIRIYFTVKDPEIIEKLLALVKSGQIKSDNEWILNYISEGSVESSV